MRTRSRRLAVTLLGLSLILIAGCGGDSSPTEPSTPPPTEDPDRDNDGILNVQDVCPDDPETVNGLTDEDGCPDSTLDFYNLVSDDVEAIWTHLFNDQGETYEPLSGFSAFFNSVNTTCGSANAAVGPFYCPSSYVPPAGGVYYPIGMMDEWLLDYGPGGPGVVIAHEVGHHVSNQLGYLELKALGLISNKFVELQADCWAGVYAWSVEQRGFLDNEDMDGAAEWLVFGGDPAHTWFDPTGHGTPEQRQAAFRLGFESGIRGSCLTLSDPDPPTTMDHLTIGEDFTCGLTSNGGAFCWGRNGWGQLGDGTQTSRALPTLVAGGMIFTQMALGPNATCGLTNSGSAYCWGDDSFGLLGDGDETGTPKTVPVAVMGGLDFVQVDAGLSFSCAVTSSGAAHCWGDNRWGQLGTGTGVNSMDPIPVSGGLSFSQISVGYKHSCGLTSTGTAYCWGDNAYGQIGNGTQDSVWAPAAVSGGNVFTQIDAGTYHSCGVSAGGTAYCWGQNGLGQLGDGTMTDSSVPVPVSGGLVFSQVSAAQENTCGVTTDGAAYCWGGGYLGNEANFGGPEPIAVSGGLTFSTITAGDHSCGTTTGGAVYCWGDNAYGELGTGEVGNHYSTPTQVSNMWQ